MNNTVSPKQVQAIIREIDEITANTKVKAENAGSGFLAKMKSLWADSKAVEFAKNISNSMNASIDELAQGGNNLKEGVVGVANFYARKAGKPSMNAPHTNFNSAINPGVVSDTFDGDEYGFKDAGSVATIVGEIATLSSTYKKMADEAASRLNSINAYGNPEVKSKLLSAASNISNNLIGLSNKIEKEAETTLQAAAKDYDIGDVGSFFAHTVGASTGFGAAKTADYISNSKVVEKTGNAILDSAKSVKDLGSDTVELGKEAVKNPKLVGEAFVHSAKDLKDNAVDTAKDAFNSFTGLFK